MNLNFTPDFQHHQLYLALRWLTSLIDRHTAEIKEDTERLKRESRARKGGYDPNQPRVLSGYDDGGQWSGGGGMGGGAPPPFPRRKPGMRSGGLSSPLPRRKPNQGSSDWWDNGRNGGLDLPPADGRLQDIARDIADRLDPADAARTRLREGAGIMAAAAAVTVGTLALPEVIAVARVLAASTPTARLFLAETEQQRRILNAAKAIEDFLGGRPKPEDVFRNPNEDLIIMRGDKKYRTDIENPGYGENGEPDAPHFHLEKFMEGEWRDAGQGHRIYFKKGEALKWAP